MAEAVGDNSNTGEIFEKAANHVRKVLVGKLETPELLSLYALYKQATDGVCPSGKPHWYEFQAKHKWEAWHSLGNMEKTQAMTEYILKVQQIDPKWNWNDDENVGITPNEGWVTVSCLLNTEQVLNDCDKTIFDWVKEGHVERVRGLISSKKADVQVIDHEGMALIHWAADRGNLEMLKVLVELEADLNVRDQEGQTALHYASSCGHVSVISYLLDSKADPSIADVYGMLPVHVASSIEICSLFQKPDNQ